MSTTVAPARSARVDVLDGIRGIAILLVLLSHTWIIAPTTRADLHNGFVRVLMSSGDFAVTIFFVVGGFLATAGMLREVQRTGTLRPGVGWIRRWIRISAHVYPLVLVVLALTAIDQNMQAYRLSDTRESAWRIVTYTWNGYVRTHALEARPDLGHLWYVCTDIWGIAFVLAVVFLLRRHRIWLLGALAATTVLVMVYRHHVLLNEGMWSALIRVQTRVDGILWGAMAAVALTWLGHFADVAPKVARACTLALVPLAWAVFDDRAYLGTAGWILNATMAVFVVAVALSPGDPALRRLIASPPLQTAGRYSLVLYLWHYPIFYYLSRNTPDWSWQQRTAVGYAVTVVVAVLSQRVVERPLQRWLASDRWRTVDHGIPTALRGATVSSLRRLRPRRETGASPTDPAPQPGRHALRSGKPARVD
jgi:peptidoglycan/LPS O-acetylase OafA/YrhL